MDAAQNIVPRQDQPVALNDATTVLQVIARAAQDPQCDVEKIERLLQMHERLAASQAKAAYQTALAAMQPELPIISERGGIKDRGGNIQSTYALWEDIVGVITPILSRHGFALSFRTGNDNGGVRVTGVLSHSAGHSEQTELLLPIDTSGSKNAVQSVGSSTSYGKRYTASALLNLRTGEPDDDGLAGGSEPRIDDDQLANIEALLSEVGADRAKFMRYLKISSLDEILARNYEAVVRLIESRRRR